MSIRFDVAIAIVALALVGGCDGGGKKDAKETGEAKPTASAAADMSDEAVDEAEVPTEEDFEDEAYETITADNVDSEVDKLAAEINGG